MDAAGGISIEPGARPGSDWSDAAAWAGDGLRREVFFFRSAGVELYGSLYVAAEISRPYGVVAFQSWGVEADRTDPLVRTVALEMARLGGAGLVFHYPGYGDSYGDLTGLDLVELAEAGGDAVAEASRRCPGLDWILAGFMFGAAVACLAQRWTAARLLLLVQPELRPAAYFRRLAASSEQLAPGPSPMEMIEAKAVPGMVYGYPAPRGIVDRAAEADAAARSALAVFDGEGAVVRHLKPADADADALVPGRFERLAVPGAWRFGSQNQPALARASGEWLERSTSP